MTVPDRAVAALASAEVGTGRLDVSMGDDEVAAFLSAPHVLQVATIGRDGRPHLVAMWYGFLGEALGLWTYARSQKVVNLRRDPRVTCLAETGSRYDELKGVQLVATARVVHDRASVDALGAAVWARYMGELDDEAAERVRRMGAKRVAVLLDIERVVSWDHARMLVTAR